MVKRKNYFFLPFIFFISISVNIYSIDFDVSYDKQISLNQSCTVIITINGGRENVQFESEDFILQENFSSTQISFYNGNLKMSSTHKLKPKRKGKLKFYVIVEQKRKGPFNVDVSDATFNSQQVEPFVINKISKKDIYINQLFILNKIIYSPYSLQVEQFARNDIGDGLFLKPRKEIIIQEHFSNTNINGQNYYSKILSSTSAFAQKSGKINIHSARVVTSRLSGFFRSRKDIDVLPLTINVLPFPNKNKPKEFKGSVAKKINLNVEIKITDQQKIRAHEPFTLKISVSGIANFGSIILPSLNISEDWILVKPIKPRELVEWLTNSEWQTGTKSIDYYIIPSKSGLLKINSLSLSYFSPIKKQYITIQSKSLSIPIKSNPNYKTTNENSINNKNFKDTGNSLIKFNEDIRFIEKNYTQSFFPIFKIAFIYFSYLFSINLLIFSFILYKIVIFNKQLKTKNKDYYLKKDLNNYSKKLEKKINYLITLDQNIKSNDNIETDNTLDSIEEILINITQNIIQYHPSYDEGNIERYTPLKQQLEKYQNYNFIIDDLSDSIEKCQNFRYLPNNIDIKSYNFSLIQSLQKLIKFITSNDFFNRLHQKI